MQLAGSGERRQALDLTLEWAERASPTSAITDLLVPSLVEIGRRWQSGVWTVAQEHVASGVTDFVLAVLANRHPVQVTRPGLITVVCAEGEWHAVAAHVVAELLRLDGWAVETLGGSTPRSELGAYLGARSTVAVTAHCSMTSNLGGLLGTIEAAHRFGVPVIAGGRAVTPERARRLGADACATGLDIASVTALLMQWSTQPPAALATARPGPEYYRLEAHRSELVDHTLVGVFETFPALAGLDTAQLRDLREEVDHLVRFLAASLVVEEPAILHEECRWFDEVFSNRGLPSDLVTVCAASLRDAIATLGGDPVPRAEAVLGDVIRQRLR